MRTHTQVKHIFFTAMLIALFNLITMTALPQVSSLSFLPAVSYDSGGYEAFSIAVADVNGDGKPDLMVANYCAGNARCDDAEGKVGVLFGNGDGTFKPAVTYRSGGYRSVSLVAADVNGDGRPDLLVANQWVGVGVLLGNGNGTFRAAVTYSCSSGYSTCSSVAVADLNGDGNPDLVVTTWSGGGSGGSVGVLQGNGDGTFQAVVSYPASGPKASAIADVNGDGKLDVVVADGSGAGVLLGNGDGTLQPEVTCSAGGVTPTSIVSADLNDDGKQDLVVMNFDSGNVGVLLGNGDGTFQPAVTYGGADGAGTPSVAVADVNGDGKLDMLVVNFCVDKNCDGGIGVFPGNGDGTFQPESVFLSGGYYAWSLAAADLNGDGKLDLVAANLQRSASLPLKGIVGVLINNTVFSTPTTTKLVSSPNPSLVGQAIAFTANVTSSRGAPPNGENITFYNGSAILGTAMLSAGTATLTTSVLPAGIFTIKASYPGNSTFAASASPGLTQTVHAASKSVTATTLASGLNPSIYGQKLTLIAQVTTSGPVLPTGTVTFMWKYFTQTYTIGTATLDSAGVATLTKSNLNANLNGDMYSMTAVYRGDTNNLSSTSPVLNQTVLQTTSKATITSSQNPSAQGQAVTLTAKIASPTVLLTGPVTFVAGSTTLASVQLRGGQATFTTSSLPAGSTIVKVRYDGNSNIKGSSGSLSQIVQP